MGALPDAWKDRPGIDPNICSTCGTMPLCAASVCHAPRGPGGTGERMMGPENAGRREHTDDTPLVPAWRTSPIIRARKATADARGGGSAKMPSWREDARLRPRAAARAGGLLATQMVGLIRVRDTRTRRACAICAGRIWRVSSRLFADSTHQSTALGRLDSPRAVTLWTLRGVLEVLLSALVVVVLLVFWASACLGSISPWTCLYPDIVRHCAHC